MKYKKLLYAFLFFLSFFIHSCDLLYYEPRENQGPHRPERSITDQDQAKLEEARRQHERDRITQNPYEEQGWEGANTQYKPQASDYPTATPVTGKPGFIYNPYTHNMVDVRGIASGTLCFDPEDPNKESNKFRVP